MKGRLKQKPGVSVRRGLSVQLKDAIGLLSLNNFELGELLRKELEVNPFLEEKSAAELPTTWEDTYRERSLVESEAPSSDADSFDQFVSDETTLQEYLLEQLSTSACSSGAAELVEVFISALDHEGFLGKPHREVIGSKTISLNYLTEAVEFLKTLDPPGVGASDVWESLEWQAQVGYPGDHLLLDVISAISNAGEQLGELSAERIDELASFLHAEPADIARKLELLKTLKPHPAAAFNRQKSRYIYPDLIFSVQGEDVSVQLSRSFVPEVTLNAELLELAQKNKMTPEWTNYYKNAQEMIRGITYRNSTLLKVGLAIVKKQPAFFKQGEEALVPLGLKDVSKDVGVHISTVSRIVSQKYCLSPFGVLPLKVFFPRKLKSNSGLNLGSRDLKDAIAEIIEEEDATNPLSDSAITEILIKKGFDIRRRTVAKYRKLLHIPSMNKRKA